MPTGSGSGAEAHQRRHQITAMLAIAFTLIVLITPGSVLHGLQVVLEPALTELREWQLTWWSWPASDDSGSTVPLDKAVHLLLFIVCSVLAARAWASYHGVVRPMLALMVFAAATELLQSLVPGRGMSAGDFVADCIGIGAGFCLWYLFRFTMKTT